MPSKQTVNKLDREPAPILARPLLKWAGGKGQLLDKILPKFPKTYNKYIEPFFGGGAVFFGLAPEHSLIADSNPELINLYRCIAENPEGVMHFLKGFQNSKEAFYEMRALDPKASSETMESMFLALHSNSFLFAG